MLARAFRLKEREVKRVLRRRNPLFSSSLTANTIPNTLGTNRFAFILGGKSARTSVDRNFFRRRFYTACQPYIHMGNTDFVLMAKRGMLFLRRDAAFVATFDQDLARLLQKAFPPKPSS